MQPFKDKAVSTAIGDMTIEGNADRVALYGSLQVTRDKAGLQLAEQLKGLADALVAELKATPNLPDTLTPKGVDSVDNPFNRS